MKLKIKDIFERSDRPQINSTTNPWLIEQVKNGLKAVNVKILTDLIRPDKKLPAVYFENDRIQGTGAYASDGILKVMDMFDELQDLTPKTIGYIFNNKKYLYHCGGILRIDTRSKDEEYFSGKTLRNENIDNFFQLSHTEPEIAEDEDNTTREDVYSESTELTTT